MKAKTFWIIILISAIILLVLTVFNFSKQDKINKYNPSINPNEFTSIVDNKYFSLEPSKKLTYLGESDEGTEKIETFITDEKKVVNGIETTVVWDRVWLNGELIEDTYDYYAQDKEGNVWYFGEDSKEIEDGQVVSTHGSWLFGKDSAKPGIIMFANPIAGNEYRQEYYKGEAEDMAEILSISEEVNIDFDSYSNCVKTRDFTPLEPGVEENKYYCPDVGGIVLETNPETNERVELISVEYNSNPSE